VRNHTDPWLGWQGATLRLAVFLTATIIGAVVLIPIEHPFGILIWILLVVGGLLYLVHWHTESFEYRCPHPDCGAVFVIPWWLNLISPQGIGRHGGRKFLRCPQCRRFGWAQVLARRHR
jgi:hypothetical protein